MSPLGNGWRRVPENLSRERAVGESISRRAAREANTRFLRDGVANYRSARARGRERVGGGKAGQAVSDALRCCRAALRS